MLPLRMMLLLLVFFGNASSKTMKYEGLGLEPDGYRNATELVTSKGYPAENHYVTTQDGYILNLLRVPHGRHPSPSTDAPRAVVVLQHGLLGDCTSWILNGADESLAFILADHGADVWMGNVRGNYYSTNHTVLKPDDERFWNFTWDDMAKYDLPATINYALATSNASQLYYIGHSQGTTMAFAGFWENQQLAAKVKHFLAFAPVARLNYAKSPLRYLAPYAKTIEGFLDKFGHGVFGNTPEVRRILHGERCEEKWRTEICENLSFLVMGFNKASMNLTRVPVYESHNPSSTSTINLLHWAQMINSKAFQKFDFGTNGNLIKYNQTTPPPYNPRNMKLPPVALFSGGHDWLSSLQDAAWLRPQLHVTLDSLTPDYEHLDFILAMDAARRIYPAVLELIFGDA